MGPSVEELKAKLSLKVREEEAVFLFIFLKKREKTNKNYRENNVVWTKKRSDRVFTKVEMTIESKSDI